MSTAIHTMPADEFLALARGEARPSAVDRLVAAQLSKHMILLRGVMQLARRVDHPDVRLAAAGLTLLDQVRRDNPAAARLVIGYPSVGAWALHTLRGEAGRPSARPGMLAAIAAAAAFRAGIAAEIEVPVINGAVLLPSLGTVAADDSTALLRTSPAQITVGGQWRELRLGAPDGLEIRRLRAESPASPFLALVDDLDPFRMPADDGAPTGRLTDAQVAEFGAALQGAWEVLPPASAAEIAAIVRVIVPFQAPDGGLVSTSSPQSFGAVAMSRQPDRYTCAETLVHETQHLKLSALLDLVQLTMPDDGSRYYAPWRPDPRPVSGLLQGAYAFLGVTGFWRTQRATVADPDVRARADAEFARWRDAAALAAGTLLDSGRLKPAGADFVAEMARVLAGWQRESVAGEALAMARGKADMHRTEWQAANG
jgi:uncharacterized protein